MSQIKLLKYGIWGEKFILSAYQQTGNFSEKNKYT